MKKVIITLLSLIFIIATVGVGAYFHYYNNVKSPLTDGTKNIVVEVKENESLYELLERLESEKVIKSANLSKLFFKLSKKDLGIQVGKHEINRNGDLNDFLSSLKNENLDNRLVSIPEGYTIEQIADVLDKGDVVTRADFLKAIKEYKAPSYIKENKDRRYKLEGFLKADEYSFKKGMTSEEIIKILNDKFTDSFKKILEEEKINLPEDKWDDVINKAAMIEKETWVPEEKSIIASVIENRIKDDMQLQIDATILYAVNDQKKEITMEDILSENPYNTYHVHGLPAGPICNPGIASIKGALNPDTTDYKFYLVNPKTGKHYFTKDYDDFMAKRDEYNSYTTPPTASNTNKVESAFKTAPSVDLTNKEKQNGSETTKLNNYETKKTTSKTTEEIFVEKYFKSFMPTVFNPQKGTKNEGSDEIKISYPKITIPKFQQ